MEKPKIILIGGPTASGKSALALEKALEHNGVVINADAMQIYKDLPILSAQPPLSDRQKVPHELYEILDPAEKSSAGVWLSFAEKAIQTAVKSGKTPIVVGGTGLYFKALTEGLAEIPEIPPEIRENAQKLYETLGSDAFRAKLHEKDPLSAQNIKPNDRQRLVRAYEVVTHTGVSLPDWQKQSNSHSATEKLHVELLLLMPEREKLYAQCDRRFLTMIEQGALDEVRRLKDRNLSSDLPALKILGVRELAAHLDGELSLDEAISKAQQMTRNYAKRQLTWFRHQWKGNGFPLTRE